MDTHGKVTSRKSPLRVGPAWRLVLVGPGSHSASGLEPAPRPALLSPESLSHPESWKPLSALSYLLFLAKGRRLATVAEKRPVTRLSAVSELWGRHQSAPWAHACLHSQVWVEAEGP